MADFIESTVCMIVCVLFISVSALTIGYFVDKISCEATARALGFNPHYTLLTGCMVEKPNGTRVLLEQIRNVGISKE